MAAVAEGRFSGLARLRKTCFPDVVPKTVNEALVKESFTVFILPYLWYS